jgi:hypothetical protein
MGIKNMKKHKKREKGTAEKQQRQDGFCLQMNYLSFTDFVNVAEYKFVGVHI